MSKVTLHWHSQDHPAIADGMIEENYQRILEIAKSAAEVDFHISNMLILQRFRVGLIEKDFDELYFVKDGTEVKLEPPNAWLPIFDEIDLNFDYLHRLIGW